MAMRLIDAARVIRSKNAGPLHLTLDLMFPSEEVFRIACASRALTAEAVALLYGVPPEQVDIVPFAAAHAIKITIPRPVVAGDLGDADVYGAQQHRPLLGVVL